MPMTNWRVDFSDGSHVDVVAANELEARVMAIARRFTELGYAQPRTLAERRELFKRAPRVLNSSRV